jgi:hypothetical protein
MNLLIDKLPTKAEIDGKEYEINTDFRNVLIYFRLLKDKVIEAQDKFALLINLFFKVIPSNISAAMNYINDFWLLCGSKRKDENSKRNKIVFDFDQDSPLIFAAFYQEYGINLNEEKMHWFVFKALFDGLSEMTYFPQ